MSRHGLLFACLAFLALATSPALGRSYVVLDDSMSIWSGDICDPPTIQARVQSSHRATVVSLYRLHRGKTLQLLGQVKRHRQGCYNTSVLRGACQASRNIFSSGQSASCNIPMFYSACGKGHRTYTQATFTSEVFLAETSAQCLSVQCQECPDC